MKGHVDLMSLAMNPRYFNSVSLVNLVGETGEIRLEPGIQTHLGVVNTIYGFGEIWEDGMEEHRIGYLDDLTNEEFNQVFSSAFAAANK